MNAVARMTPEPKNLQRGNMSDVSYGRAVNCESALGLVFGLM